ncbi:hypothetical protein AAVH_07294 [Aphelenchoides avenae]|nr:hypothetical protein AAVH_07294 [Aphelenchus avenae]
MGTGEIDFGEEDDEQIASSCSAASTAAKSSCHSSRKPPTKPPKARVKKEPLKLEPLERPKRRSVVLAEKLIAKCNEEVQFLYDSKTDPSFRCSLPIRFRKPKKEEPADFWKGSEQACLTIWLGTKFG